MVLKPIFGTRVRVVYTDTDSLIISLRSSNESHDLKKFSDTINYESKLFRFKVRYTLDKTQPPWKKSLL